MNTATQHTAAHASTEHSQRDMEPSARRVEPPHPHTGVPRSKESVTRGSVTAEFAVLLPALVLLLAFIGAIATVGAAQVRSQHAAGMSAREEARGSHIEVAKVAGDGATQRVDRSGEWVTVEVRNNVKLWTFLGPGITVHATATARVEESAASGQQ
ncbi:hypothetical protein CAY35_02040 [Pseudoglutamicibacter cumminsii]|uniref:TadE family protein n=1 Tax=Pseudoglutamicibacter cumminsii TaxID=156979 RepID=A0ABX5L611_9MICC|nr:hypothetical protein CYJ35_05780 [Pseudoglutamicibacter albus]PWI28252.1 hypothetical protein CAY35_02040 [Pseudoglutamicibacter cumminsii]